MTFDESDLRRALDARSGDPSPEYRARLHQALAQPRPATNWTAVIAVLTVTVLTAGTIGILVAARNARPQGGVASGARVSTPSRIVLPSYAKVMAPNSTVVWVLIDGRLFRSTDQGNHWQERPMPPQFGVRAAISFIDDQQGWLLAPGSPTTQCGDAAAQIWHTSNGGATWTQLPATGMAAAQCKENISFVDSNVGFITAWDDNHRPVIYHTSDGGMTWSGSPLPDPPDFTTQPGGDTLRASWVKRFGTTLYLMAFGMQESGQRQYVFTSNDGGATWRWKTKVASPYVVMVTESRWLQLVWPGQSYESTNGGQQFHLYDSDFHTDTPVGGPQIVFADANVGYAEGRGAVQRTTDGGAHWVRIKTPGT